MQDKSFGLARPHPAFGHPLPEGEGPRCTVAAQLLVGQQPLAPWLEFFAAPRLFIRSFINELYL